MPTALPDSRRVNETDKTGLWPPDVTPRRPSLNVSWLRDVLSMGLPASITTRFTLESPESSDYEHDWHGTPEGLAVGQILSHLGLLVIPTVESDVDSASELPAALASIPDRLYQEGNLELALADMSEDAQRKRAHWHARKRAFDMDYLSRERNWGPYLPVQASSPQETESPPADELRPDWSWLVAARVVAESTLRAERRGYGLELMAAWNNIREGAWVPPSDGRNREKSSDNQAPGVEGTHSDVAGYDWAGAEGTWRYV